MRLADVQTREKPPKLLPRYRTGLALVFRPSKAIQFKALVPLCKVPNYVKQAIGYPCYTKIWRWP